MQIETDNYSSIIIEPEAYIEESYDLLEEGLMEFLNNPSRHFDPVSTDYLEAVSYKILVAKSEVEPEDYYKLEDLQNKANTCVLINLLNYYNGCIDPEMLEGLSYGMIYFLYHIFFHEKRKKAVSCVSSYVATKRKDFLSRHKVNKKDIGYEHLLQEFSDFRNKDNLSLVVSYLDIFKQVTGDTNGNLSEVVFNNLDLSFSQLNFLYKLFNDSIGTEPYLRFFKDLSVHQDFSYIASEFRSELIEKLRNLD